MIAKAWVNVVSEFVEGAAKTALLGVALFTEAAKIVFVKLDEAVDTLRGEDVSAKPPEP